MVRWLHSVSVGAVEPTVAAGATTADVLRGTTQRVPYFFL